MFFEIKKTIKILFLDSGQIAPRNVEGAPTGGQVRLVDVAFRKQMDALYRRIDLFRTHNRNRSMRKPFIVQRTMVPNAESVRKMMTLSIDSLGTNRAGFQPLSNQASDNSDEPKLEAVGATIPSASNTNQVNSDPSASRWNSPANGDDSVSQTQIPSSSPAGSSVLAQAAEEAGLISGANSTNVRTTNDEGNSAAETQPKDRTIGLQLSNDDQTSNSTFQNSTEKTLTPDDCSTSHDDYQPSMIKNDVALPIRPPSPNVDSISDIFDFTSTSSDFLASASHEKVSYLMLSAANVMWTA